jgi:hypothetical protein
MHTKRKGNVGELRVALQLSGMGYSVFKEIGDISRIDLIAEVGKALLRIQVKYITRKNGCYTFVSKKFGPGYRFSYDVEDVDVFALYCAEDDVVAWVFSRDFIVDGKPCHLTLRSPLFPSKNNQECKLRRLEDFMDFDRCVLRKLVCSPVLD